MIEKIKQIYENKYKQLMVITILLLLFSIGVLGYTKITTGEFIKKDVSLKGGLLVTIKTDKQFDTKFLESQIEKSLGISSNVKSLTALAGQSVGYVIEIEQADKEKVLQALEELTGVEKETFTIEESSPAISKAFFKSTIKAIIIAFVFMSIVVFFYFRIPIPSLAVIFAAFSDLIGTLAFMQLFGIKLSTAGVAALLMLIGYSVDTDILLSTRLLKRSGQLMDSVYSSIKTGLTMQTTAIAALTVLYIVTPAALLRQISIILIIGLILDIFNTWIQNVGILKWYLERKGK